MIELHSGQLEVFSYPSRFKVVVAGRRWGKCCGFGTLIALTGGNHKEVQEIKEGDLVLTINENTYELESKKVKHLHDNGVKELLCVRTRSGKELEVTPNHPLLANNIWTESRNINVGDLIAVPRKTTFGNILMDANEIDMLAIWIAEGSSNGYTNETPEIVEIMDVAAKSMGTEFSDAGYGRRSGLCWKWRGVKKGRGSNGVVKMLRWHDLLGKTSKTKFIPDEIFSLPKNQLARFLNLFVACDGSVNRRAKNTWAMEIGLANEKMIHQLADLFLKFGIRGSISYKKHKAKSSVTGKNFESWRFIVSDSESLAIFCEEIGALSKEKAVKSALTAAKKSTGSANSYLPIAYDDFIQHLKYTPEGKGKYGGYNAKVSRDLPKELRLGLNSWKKQTRSRISRKRYESIRKFSDGYFDSIADGDFAWDEVASVKEAGEDKTYDLTVEGNHNFIAGGMVTHNTELSKAAIVNAASVQKRLIWYVAPTYGMARQIMWQNVIDALPPRWIVKKNETIMRIELINKTVIQLKGADKPDCYDDKTEILTDKGWKFFKDLDRSENVLTLNPKTNTAEYKRPYKYVDQHYSGPMHRVKSGKIDLLVTPEHRFQIESGKGVRKLKRVEDLSYNDKIPASCNWIGKDSDEITHDHCALMGFYLAEGSTYGNSGGDITKRSGNYEVVFSQSRGIKGGDKGDVRKQFKEVLDRLGYNYRKTDIGLHVCNKRLWQDLLPIGNCYTKSIPDAYRNLPPEKLRTLIHWMLLGDGIIRGAERVYYSVSKSLVNDLQEIAIKAGFSANFRIKPQRDCEIDGRKISATTDLYSVSIYGNKFNYFRDSKETYIKQAQYSGKVYCVGVENHTLMVRRNGKMCWSGNTLRGVGLHYVVMDEFQDMKLDTWTKVLQPTLATTGGHALFIGCVVGKTRILSSNGFRRIDSFSSGESSKSLVKINESLYGSNREFHNADGFWNNGIVKTKTIHTQSGFSIQSSFPHPLLVMGQEGIPVWKKTKDIKVGDRTAQARGMNVWAEKNPFEKCQEHMVEWRKGYRK